MECHAFEKKRTLHSSSQRVGSMKTRFRTQEDQASTRSTSAHTVSLFCSVCVCVCVWLCVCVCVCVGISPPLSSIVSLAFSVPFTLHIIPFPSAPSFFALYTHTHPHARSPLKQQYIRPTAERCPRRLEQSTHGPGRPARPPTESTFW